MRRVVVLGCGGSGKSTLATSLATATGLPLVHLDGIFYNELWQPLPADEFDARQRHEAAKPSWIMDGNYAGTLPIRLTRADTVIFLDLSAARCLWGIARRRWRYRGGQHPDAGVFDRITWSFIRYIANYRRAMRPRVLALIAEHAATAQIITLTNRRQSRRFLDAHHTSELP